MKKILQILFLLTALFCISFTSKGNVFFSIKIWENEYLNYYQKRSINLINHILSKYMIPENKITYFIELKTSKKKQKAIIINSKRIIFHEDPVKLVSDKKHFFQLAHSIIENGFVSNNTRIAYNDNLNWIISAVFRRLKLKLQRKVIPFKGSFPGIHYLMISGKRLKPGQILNSYLYQKPETNIAFKIYAEECEMLLFTLSMLPNGRKIISNYLKKTLNLKNQTNSSYSILISSIKTYLPDKKNIEKYLTDELNKNAFNYSVNTFMPATAKFCKKRLNSLNLIKYNLKDNSEKKGTCGLKELISRLDKMDAPKKVLGKLIDEFQSFYIFAPYFLKPSLSKTLEILSQIYNSPKNINQEKQQRYSLALQKALDEFNKGVQKQKKLENILNEYQLKAMEYPVFYKKYFKLIKESQKEKHNYYPALNKYMFKLNKKYYY
ncbi:MAG: hypothetical protein K9M56_07615 [Victivallales bacterium]|nr:hypothetical protein [Victivallales bacterium]